MKLESLRTSLGLTSERTGIASSCAAFGKARKIHQGNVVSSLPVYEPAVLSLLPFAVVLVLLLLVLLLLLLLLLLLPSIPVSESGVLQ